MHGPDTFKLGSRAARRIGETTKGANPAFNDAGFLPTAHGDEFDREHLLAPSPRRAYRIEVVDARPRPGTMSDTAKIHDLVHRKDFFAVAGRRDIVPACVL